MSGILTAMLGGGSSPPIIRTYSAAGSFTETIPGGYTTGVIEDFGAGGGGGNGNGSTASGGGGGSGGYARTSISVAGQAGKTLSITVGAAGAVTTPGGASTVTSGTLAITSMNAPGGGAGGSAVGATPGAAGAAGATGTGGTVANSVGNAGQPGAAGVNTGGAGGTGVVGVNGTGSNGGNGAVVISAGGAGKVIIKYT